MTRVKRKRNDKNKGFYTKIDKKGLMDRLIPNGTIMLQVGKLFGQLLHMGRKPI